MRAEKAVRKTLIFMVMLTGVHNRKFLVVSSAQKRGAHLYTTYICMCAPHLAGVGSRAISSRTTTTHPALRWAPYLEQRKKIFEGGRNNEI